MAIPPSGATHPFDKTRFPAQVDDVELNSIDIGGNVFQSPNGGLNIRVTAMAYLRLISVDLPTAVLFPEMTSDVGLAPSATNSIWLDTSNALNVGQSGFPTTAHLPLAEVITGGSTIDDFVDRRPKSIIIDLTQLGSHFDLDALTGTSVVTLDDIDGFRMNDGQQRGGEGYVVLPPGALLSSDPELHFDLYVFTAGTADGNVVIQLTGKYIGDGELSSKTPDEVFTVVVPITNTLGRRHAVITTFDRTLIAAGDAAHAKVERLGTDGSDTYDGIVMLAEVGRVRPAS